MQNGVQGHLVVIDSFAESEFVNQAAGTAPYWLGAEYSAANSN